MPHIWTVAKYARVEFCSNNQRLFDSWEKGTCSFCTYVLIKGTQVYIITFGLAMTNMEKGALGADHMDTGKSGWFHHEKSP